MEGGRTDEGAFRGMSGLELRELINGQHGSHRKYTAYTKNMLIASIRHTKSPPVRSQSRGLSQIPNNPVDSSAPPPPSCPNPACRAVLQHLDFCKRCSCCICKKYDDNKDPSLWAVCGDGDTSSGCCGFSCHLECGVQGCSPMVSAGSYRCSSCGNVTSLLRCWKKQLVQAKAARRVDVLYLRMALAMKILNGSEKFHTCNELVRAAMEELVREISPQSPACTKRIVNRLSSSNSIIQFIQDALVAFDSLADPSEKEEPHIPVNPEYELEIQEVTSDSIQLGVKEIVPSEVAVIGYKVWHRNRGHYRTSPSRIILPGENATLSHLCPGTQYTLKVVAFSATGDVATKYGKCVTKERENQEEEEPGEKRDVNDKEDVETSPIRRERRLSELPVSPLNMGRQETASNGIPAVYLDALADLAAAELNDPTHATDEGAATMEELCNQKKLDVSEAITRPSNNKKRSEQPEPPKQYRIHIDLEALPEEEPEPLYEQATINREKQPAVANPMNKTSTSNTEAIPSTQQTMSKDNANTQTAVQENISVKEAGLNIWKKEAAKSKSFNFIPKPPLNEVVQQINNATSPGKGEAKGEGKGEAKGEGKGEAKGEGKGEEKGKKRGHSVPKPPLEVIIPKIVPQKVLGPALEKMIDGKRAVDGRVFEDCLKIVRWLEVCGYIRSDFRVRFFTWLSLRADENQKKIVSVYIDTMIGDPTDLAAQLVDAFDQTIRATRRKIHYDWNNE